MQDNVLEYLKRDDSLDLIQKYVFEQLDIENFQKNNVSSEMFFLFSSVLDLGKKVREALKKENNEELENKIAEIFLVLVSLCNSLSINLFDALKGQDKILSL